MITDIILIHTLNNRFITEPGVNRLKELDQCIFYLKKNVIKDRKIKLHFVFDIKSSCLQTKIIKKYDLNYHIYFIEKITPIDSFFAKTIILEFFKPKINTCLYIETDVKIISNIDFILKGTFNELICLDYADEKSCGDFIIFNKKTTIFEEINKFITPDLNNYDILIEEFNKYREKYTIFNNIIKVHNEPSTKYKIIHEHTYD